MLRRPETPTRTESRLISKLNRMTRKWRRSKQESYNKSLILIDAYLHDARDFRSEAEVVTCALLFMKHDPTLTPSEAMQLGYEKWLI